MVEKFEPPFGERLFQSLADVGIEIGQNLFGKFQQGNRTAETAEYRSKFEPDNSGSYYAQSLGYVVDVEQFGRGEHTGKITPCNGRNFCCRPGGNENMAGGICVARFALYGVGVDQLGSFGYIGDEFVFQ